MVARPVRSREQRLPWPLASRLKLLLAVQRDPSNNSPLTLDRICELAWQRCGVYISSSHVSHLVNGRAQTISAPHLWALATVFGVPMSYFTDDDTAAVCDVVLRASLEDEAVRSIALKLVHCTPEQRQILDQLAAYFVAINPPAQTQSTPARRQRRPGGQ